VRANLDKRHDDIRQTRGLHEDGGAAALAEADVFASGSVAGEGFADCDAPAGGVEKLAGVVVGHGRTV